MSRIIKRNRNDSSKSMNKVILSMTFNSQVHHMRTINKEQRTNRFLATKRNYRGEILKF